jgi:hypothetical protein
MASNKSPIRGPEWSTAQLVRDSTGVEVRQKKGLLGLQQEFNVVFDKLLKGVDDEATATVVETQRQKKDLLLKNSDPLAPKKAAMEQQAKFNASNSDEGAFSFLNRKKE